MADWSHALKSTLNFLGTQILHIWLGIHDKQQSCMVCTCFFVKVISISNQNQLTIHLQRRLRKCGPLQYQLFG